MEQHLLDEQETQPANKRPVFLTALCVLTWMGSAVLFILHAYEYVSYSAIIRDLKASDGMDMEGGIINMFSWMMWGSLLQCICALICVAGSIAMFKQKKWGFYVYLLGEIVQMFLIGYVAFMIPYTGLIALISIGFMIMYASNLKHMRR
jgi:hypothetical protein